MARAKVFGVGFHKTGTTSLAAALRFLRYRVCHGAQPIRGRLGHQRMMELLRAREFDPVLDLARDYDAFADTPWFALFREADARFPGSRFILTIRDETRWLASARRYFARSSSDLRVWLYGVPNPDDHDGVWLDRYRRHIEAVRAHFADRPADLLLVDWERGSGWDEICTFLGVTRPTGPFPRISPVRVKGRADPDAS